MAIDRTIWVEAFDRDNFPTFPCPQCDHGRVAIDRSTLRIQEPSFSILAQNHSDWEPDWVQGRFSFYLRCNESTCGEVVIVSGEITHTEDFNEVLDTYRLISMLQPKSMFPAPPIIRLPKGPPDREMPYKVTRTIKTAFALFWVDIGSSANSLRRSVEFLLDHLKVPRTTTSKKTGKQCDLDLNGRIQLYEKNNPDHGETLRALRIVGNLGSHGLTLTREILLDAFEIYEDALTEIIGRQKEYLKNIKKKIISTKGKY